MTDTAHFAVSLLRLTLVLAPAIIAAHAVRRRMATVTGPLATVCEAILVLGWLVVLAEALGLVGALRLGWLIGLSWVACGLVLGALRRGASSADAESRVRVASSSPTPAGTDAPLSERAGRLAAALAVVVMTVQWLFETGSSLGAGMSDFDTLWYHMPFAATIAQTGSITHVDFVQADPFIAYYPQDSELFHAIGIISFGNDFLSPLVNLGWAALLLGASWCVGARWRVQWWTLCAAAVVLAFPVLSFGQPGQALSDMAGLAPLVCAVALIAAPRRGWLELAAAGVALGLALGSKYTFVVPAVILTAAIVWLSRREERIRAGLTVLGCVVLIAGWWYLRAIIHTGSPLGIAETLGPLHLPGATSPLANATDQAVISVLGHPSLWTERLAPGLTDQFGVLWPVVLIVAVAVTLAALRQARRDGAVAAIGLTAGVACVLYLFYPATAESISSSTTYFSYNLRYLTPGLLLAFLLLPALVAIHRPQLLPWMGAGLLGLALVSQIEPGVWLTQPKRHVAYLTLTVMVLAGAWLAARWRRRAVVAAAAVILVVILGGLLQHHYFARRYLTSPASSPVGAIDRWAQTVSHARIALFGTVEQYPLYGARDTNSVTYLGQSAPNGGYAPISTCTRWRRTLRTGGFRYLVLTAAPIGQIPISWSRGDPQLTPIRHPAPGDWVFAISAGRDPRLTANCS